MHAGLMWRQQLRRVWVCRPLARKYSTTGQPKCACHPGAVWRADGVTYVCSSSFDDALTAAGAACGLVDAVVAASQARQLQQQERVPAPAPAAGTAAFCLTRPPGHHATADTPLGEAAWS